MTNIVRNRSISNETWQLLDEATLPARPSDEAQARELPGTFGVLVPLSVWPAHRDRYLAIGSRLGVLLKNTDDPASLVPDLARIALIAIEFPRFSDGRGYSIARLLRGRYGYRAELRAVGDIMRDQIYYLMRVGFDSFALRDDQDPQAALEACNDFSTAYQASSDHPVPLFRRRAA